MNSCQRIVSVLALTVVVLWTTAIDFADAAPITHAHNDYLHDRPLHDALANGFHSVEADVILDNGKLLVGHTTKEAIAQQTTLEDLYLKPLRERVKTHHGSVHDDKAHFFLLIDIKTDAEQTYQLIDKQLEEYADILSVRHEGNWTLGPVTVVISGNVPHQMMINQKTCYAGIDGRPTDLDSNLDSNTMPWISTKWSSLIKWNGNGQMPQSEREKLKEYVAKAHQKSRLVRFWATPENKTVWKVLRDNNVDLIGTDHLEELAAFYNKPRP